MTQHVNEYSSAIMKAILTKTRYAIAIFVVCQSVERARKSVAKTGHVGVTIHEDNHSFVVDTCTHVVL